MGGRINEGKKGCYPRRGIRDKNASGGKKMTSKYTYLLVLLPFLVVVLLFELLPLIMLIIDSFGSDFDKNVLFTFID